MRLVHALLGGLCTNSSIVCQDAIIMGQSTTSFVARFWHMLSKRHTEYCQRYRSPWQSFTKRSARLVSATVVLSMHAINGILPYVQESGTRCYI